jgi:hypothetical protein
MTNTIEKFLQIPATAAAIKTAIDDIEFNLHIAKDIHATHI